MSCYICCLISLLLSVASVFCELSSPECLAWQNIEDYLKKEIDKEVYIETCLQNKECTGLNCSGSMMGAGFHVGMMLNHCESPASVKLFADVPQLNIHNWQQSFTHGDTYKITDDIGGEILLQEENKKFVIGLKLKFFNDKKYLPLSTPFQSDILHNVVVPVPSCEIQSSVHKSTASEKFSVSDSERELNNLHKQKSIATSSFQNCVVSNVSCPEKEMCQQISGNSSDGRCVCIPSFSRNHEGLCVYTPEVTTEVVASDNSSNSQHNNSGHALLIPILVTISVVCVVAAMVYAVIRFRFFQYLRRRLRVQVYEQVLLGQQEDNDEPLADPVA